MLICIDVANIREVLYQVVVRLSILVEELSLHFFLLLLRLFSWHNFSLNLKSLVQRCFEIDEHPFCQHLGQSILVWAFPPVSYGSEPSGISKVLSALAQDVADCHATNLHSHLFSNVLD